MSLKEIAADLNAVLEKHGVTTYAIVMMDPDSHDMLKNWDGRASDIEYGCRLIAERILRKELHEWEKQEP